MIEYKTRDFYIASLLRASNYPLLGLEREGRGQATFVFSGEKGQLSALVTKYWDRQATVDPRAFVEAINELKTRMYS